MKTCLCLFGLVELLVSCQSDQCRTAIEKPRPALAGQAPVVSVDPVKRATATQTGKSREHLISVDSTGSMKLETGLVNAAQIRLISNLPDTLGEFYKMDTLFGGHFLAIYDYGAPPALYYRSNQKDTLWQSLNLPVEEYESGQEAVEMKLDTANLDKQGQAEVLVQLSSASNGSGGGTSYKSFCLLDINPPEPKMLLRGQISIMDEWFPGYFAMHNLELAPEDQYNGYERAIILREGEIVVGRIRKRGRNKDKMYLPSLTPYPFARWSVPVPRWANVSGWTVIVPYSPFSL